MDLKIRDVAELLDISESTVRRWLVDRKIPAYKINGQYRFSRSEIEDWVMQQKLDFGDSKERAEEPLARNLQFSLYRAIYRGGVLRDILGTSKGDIFRTAMEHMARRFELDASVLTELFLDRENLMPTALNHGIGVPHTRDFLLETHFDVILTVYPRTPIDYGALDGKPVHTLFFLFACEDKHHLHLLAKLAHLFSTEEKRAFLASKPSKEHLLESVKEWETTLA